MLHVAALQSMNSLLEFDYYEDGTKYDKAIRAQVDSDEPLGRVSSSC